MNSILMRVVILSVLKPFNRSIHWLNFYDRSKLGIGLFHNDYVVNDLKEYFVRFGGKKENVFFNDRDKLRLFMGERIDLRLENMIGVSSGGR